MLNMYCLYPVAWNLVSGQIMNPTYKFVRHIFRKLEITKYIVRIKLWGMSEQWFLENEMNIDK